MDNLENNNNISEDNNVGNFNTGDFNTGNWNTGDLNTGNFNTGDWNTGDFNTGDWNTGDWNTGNFNTGDWNSADDSNGCFNTIEPTISFFNLPSDWTLSQWQSSKAREALCELTALPTVWIDEKDMSDDEKQEHSEYVTAKGYLKTRSKEEQIAETVEKWKALSAVKKRLVLSIPNFDKAIFKQITGIDVDND